ncbi:MAG: SagB/ThcOx family dehydrogenase [Candidatus Thiodiazotropha sp.]
MIEPRQAGSGAIDTIRAYHERTKHHLNGYARGPEYLDWDSQPDPFRRFSSAPLISLPLNPDPGGGVAAFDKAGISKLLELSMGISAWKQYGPDRWALRCNPSSGNLHPTEAYLVSSGIAGLVDAIYHYAPREHALEQRAAIVGDESQSYCLLGLTSIAWREAWKYGERAYRYVQLDVGHALGAVRYAAALLGWRVSLLSPGDTAIGDLLGLSREGDFKGAESEQPDLLLQIHAAGLERLDRLPEGRQWQGRANALGGEPYLKWPLIDEAHQACLEEHPDYTPSRTAPDPTTEGRAQLAQLIRQRRSAQAFIGKQSSLPISQLEDFLAALMPQRGHPPWDLWPGTPHLHLVLFIHRVEGLTPGLYTLPRRSGLLPELASALSETFQWQPTPITSDELPLHRLAEGDMRGVARTLACHQEIASASSFSFCMLAEFDRALERGASAYRHLHWEAGLIGQAAYLEAERIGMRGTGIGCFFDDSVHLALGIEDTRWQTLYHFTVGFPQPDTRLQTLPPYANLVTARPPE